MLYETRDLCRHHRSGGRVEARALDGVTLEIPKGSLTVIVGPSGSGKTTLLALLGALDRPTSGRLLLEGEDLSVLSGAALARVRRRIGFVFQDFALIPGLTSLENVTYPLIPRGIPRAERERRAREWLARLGMQARINAPARGLSGGEQQRVALARALAGEPEILLADEPTSNLDAATAEILRETLLELRASGRTVIVSTHDPALVALADRRIGLEVGRVMAKMPDARIVPEAADTTKIECEEGD